MSKVIDFTKRYEGNTMCVILDKIKNKSAMDLLQEYNVPLEPPIDISMLLKKIDISLIEKDFSAIETDFKLDGGTILGAAVSKGDQLAIFFSNKSTYNRKVFTIAHELAHCCLHAESLKISHVELRTADATDPREVAANIFAGELLIPLKVLQKKYDEFIIPSLKDLSVIFGVSTNVMAARLDHLGMPYFKDVPNSEVSYV